MLFLYFLARHINYVNNIKRREIINYYYGVRNTVKTIDFKILISISKGINWA